MTQPRSLDDIPVDYDAPGQSPEAAAPGDHPVFKSDRAILNIQGAVGGLFTLPQRNSYGASML